MSILEPKELRILAHLARAGGWHYGLELVDAGLSSRPGVYPCLAHLIETGLVEMRDEAESPGGLLPRKLYRSLVVYRPAEGKEGGHE